MKQKQNNQLLRGMKDRFNKLGTTMLGALCLLSTCGITNSCTDDYPLVDKKPSFLGASIYDELATRHKDKSFKTTLRLVDDLGYKDVLSKTGSLTLFVASDSAYDHFFATTDWKDGNGNPIRSYEQLSVNQKRLLLNNAMINNPYLIEMMSNTENNGKYLCLRQGTSISVTDSIPYWSASSLPVNITEKTEENATGPESLHFWDYYRLHKPGIYMAVDATAPMMTHFLENQMNHKLIKHSDVEFILNLPKGSWPENGGNRSYIYNRKVVEQDVTCANGYFHILDSVLVTPPNMAEVIRRNPSTQLFSQMLDRFSAPYYDANLTTQYSMLHNIHGDSVFQKRYIANNTSIGRLVIAPDKKTNLNNFPRLNYDPGWNRYAVSSSIPKEQDMAAMFVPTDDAMKKYFVRGGGRVLMDRYALKPNTDENLAYNLAQVPLDVIQALINNLMKESFNETVPSKYLTIMNDAQDQMFTVESYPSVDKYKELFEKVLLANNGVVYVMKEVISPADYAAVSAPVLLSKKTKVLRAVLRADEPFIETGYENAPLKQYFSTYLKAMQSRFSFFAPTDEGLGLYGYVDPSTIVRGVPNAYRYWRFSYEVPSTAMAANAQYLPIRMEGYKYDQERGQSINDLPAISKPISRSTDLLNASEWGKMKKALLSEIVNQHTIVHENGSVDGINGNRQYYTSRSGAPVIVHKRVAASTKGVGMEVEGGYQIELNQDASVANDNYSTVIEGYDMTKESNGYGNGMTYFIDRPMQPSMKSVYDILSTKDEFHDFFELCNPTKFDQSVLQKAGLKDSIQDKAWGTEVNKYRIFESENEKYLVRFFNNYRYTIYVPTNDKIKEAIQKGLPTWESITAFVNDHANQKADGTLTDAAKVKAQAMITCLINFIKYHFQDGVYYVDNVTSKEVCQTSCIDHIANASLYVTVNQTNGAISVEDNAGKVSHVNPRLCNILARDMHFDRPVKSAVTTCVTVSSSSYVAIHQIDNVLNFAPLINGRYDSAWSTIPSARRFVKQYKVRK